MIFIYSKRTDNPTYKYMIKGPYRSDIACEKLLDLVRYFRYHGNYRVKIGITNSPQDRWNQHYKDDGRWEGMIVIYETNSRTEVEDIERFLILNNFNYNRSKGGEGNKGRGTKQYVYILIRKWNDLGFFTR